MSKYTINDIARISGYSRGTVSRVLNNDKNVKPKTREIIKKVIQDVNYQPSAMARGLVNGRMDMIALIMGDVRNPFFSGIAYHVQNIMREYGYMVVLFNSNFDEEIERKNVQAAQEMNFCGIFLISSVADAEKYEELSSKNCPIVLLQRIVKNFRGDFVVQDNFRAGYMVTNHLIELGHNRICFLHGPKNSASSISRIEGFKGAMANAMLPIEDEYMEEGDYSFDMGYSFGEKYLESYEDKPRAVICGNDMMAIGFIEACREKGVKVPEDISVAGFDDIEMAGFNGIQLTTVHQAIPEMCQKACEIMEKRIMGQKAPVSRVMFDPILVVRRTTAPFIDDRGQ